MIVPRNMLKPHLATCCFRLVGIYYTVLYNVINPLPLGSGRSLHNTHTEFYKHIATLNFLMVLRRERCFLCLDCGGGASFVLLASFTDQSLLLGVQIMLLLWKISLLFSCMT